MKQFNFAVVVFCLCLVVCNAKREIDEQTREELRRLRLTPPGECPTTHTKLMYCFRDLIDLDNDGFLTVSELRHFLEQGEGKTCVNSDARFRAQWSPEAIMYKCDLDFDNKLSLTDWYNPNGCVRDYATRNYICRLCYECGWNGPPRK
jgi:hypothetical protein